MADLDPLPDEPSPAPVTQPQPVATSSLVADNLDDAFSATRRLRADGWTSSARRAFLDDLAERGSVTAACRTAGMSARAAYNLCNRDALFAIAWDAALVHGRRRLADDVLDRAVSGCIEQIWKDGAIVAERHRYDNKLSIAVLSRLDRRLDLAAERGEAHLRAAADWDAFAAAVAEERVADAEAILAPPPLASPQPARSDSATHRELHELSGDNSRLSADSDFAADETEDPHFIWQQDGEWVTDYPPPPGFSGFERGRYGERDYRRDCTPAEAAVIESDQAAEQAERRADAGRLRDLRFGFVEDKPVEDKPVEDKEADPPD